jgi:hypothetical protein
MTAGAVEAESEEETNGTEDAETETGVDGREDSIFDREGLGALDVARTTRFNEMADRENAHSTVCA